MVQTTHDNLSERFAALPGTSLVNQLELRAGTLADYAKLASHHYRGGRPATATRVLVFTHDRPTLAARFDELTPSLNGETSERRRAGLDEDRTSRTNFINPSNIAAVLVESLPALACTARDQAFNHRYGAWLKPKERAAMLNAELRCISRVVVSPPWRGLGLAVGLVNHALATAQTSFTEALAVMGRVNPFFERAGMSAYPRPDHPADARFIAALNSLGFQPADLVMVETFHRQIQTLAPVRRRFITRELHRWHNQRGRRGRGRKQAGSASNADDARTHLRAAQDHLLFTPLYFLHDNRKETSHADDSYWAIARPSAQPQSHARSACQETGSPYPTHGPVSADYRPANSGG